MQLPKLTLLGAGVVREYCRHRQIRIDCIRVALRAAGLGLDASKLSPYPKKVLRNTEYLSIQDASLLMMDRKHRLNNFVTG